VEVEFGSREASERFAPPPWVGRELTGDKRYANQSLALGGRPPKYSECLSRSARPSGRCG
jgi:CYTH domain-containing protein